MLKKIFYLFVVFLISVCSYAQRTHSNEYYNQANSVLCSLRDGDINQSTSFLKDMTNEFGEDEFISTAYGINMLIGGQENEAVKIFNEIIAKYPSNKYAYYCLSLYYLKHKNILKAKEYLNKVKNSLSDYKILNEYINVVENTNYNLQPTDEQSFNSIVLDGYYLLRNSEYKKAKELFELVCNIKSEEAYIEKSGILLSYNFKEPIQFYGSKYSETLGLNNKNFNKKNFVSGMITIKADLSKIRNASMLLFYIDDVFKGISNSNPSITFNSENYSNGTHDIRIDALDNEDNIISSTSYTIDVFNQISVSTYFDDKEMWKQLWDYVLLRPSQAAVNYMSAVCDAKTNNLQEHKFDLERVIGCDPNYKDAKSILKNNYYKKVGNKKIINGSSKVKKIAITFDDGPTDNTVELLDILDAYNAKATFFIVGKMATKHGDIIKSMREKGHQVALHSYHHYNLTRLDYNELQKEVFQGYSAIKSCGVEPSLYLRPPGGNLNHNIKLLAEDYGINIVMWTKNTTHLQQTTPETMAEYCFNSLKPGYIYLFHNNVSVTTKALPIILSYFNSMGYKCVTLDELLKEK